MCFLTFEFKSLHHLLQIQESLVLKLITDYKFPAWFFLFFYNLKYVIRIYGQHQFLKDEISENLVKNKILNQIQYSFAWIYILLPSSYSQISRNQMYTYILIYINYFHFGFNLIFMSVFNNNEKKVNLYHNLILSL